MPVLCLFGRPRLVTEDRCIDSFATKRSAYLLARVAISRQRRMMRTELADALWPGDYFDATRLRLRQELTRLRKTLDDFSEIVSTQGDWVGLDTSRVRVDVEEFESTFKKSRNETDPVRKENLLRQMIEIGNVPFLEGSQEEWIEAERSRLIDQRYTAIVDLAGILLKRRSLEEALAEARQAVQLLPNRESAHLLAMQILGDLGHMADALTQYQILRRNVAEASGGRVSAHAEKVAASLREPAPRSDIENAHQPVWTGIPVPPEPIFGREPEAKLIAERLDPQSGSARMVTLLGVGGIGKTHLLLHAARLMQTPYGGKVVFVDLTEISDPKIVPLAIRKAFGSSHRPVEDPIANLLAAIPNEPFLLALDNLEQLGSSLTPILRRLLSERPLLRLLNSSRTALNLSGEFRLVLSPLALPPASGDRDSSNDSPAIQLFVSTVEAGRMGAKVNAADWPTISDIVRLLEGVPLALQLAASRFHILGATGLLRALTDQAELTNSREDAPARHRTIRSAVSGSFDHLEPELVRVMENLAMFRGGWTLEAAAEVCATPNVMRIMEKLLDASLAYISEEGPRIRFRMLESIRQYVLTTLSAEEIFELRRRHLTWVRSISQSVSSDIITTEGLARLNALEPEIDNIREAFLFALDTDPEVAFELAANFTYFWLYRTNSFEANRFYKELFRRFPDIAPSEILLRASYSQCLVSFLLDDPEWEKQLERTLAIAVAIGNEDMRVKIYAQMLFRTQNVMDYEGCRDVIRRAESWIAEHGTEERHGEGFFLRAKGDFIYYQGDYATALADFQNAYEWFEKRGCLFSMVRVKLHLARAAMESGQLIQASAAMNGLAEEVRHIGFGLLDGAVCETAGRLALRLGNFEEALTHFSHTESGFRQGIFGFQTAAQHNHRGRVYLAMGKLPEAKYSFWKAIEMWLGQTYPVAVSVALYGMAATCLEAGKPDIAARIFAAGAQEIARRGAKVVPFEQDFADQTAAAIQSLGGDVDALVSYIEGVELARQFAAT